MVRLAHEISREKSHQMSTTESSSSRLASPTSSLSESSLSSGASSLTGTADQSSSLENVQSTKCSICQETYTLPKVLACFHTFCQPCLEKSQEAADKIKCPQCEQECTLTSQGVGALLSDYAVSNWLESTAMVTTSLSCTGCKSKDSNAVARCFDCANFLCSNCVMAHQFMHCFEGHRVVTLTELQNNKDDLKLEKPVSCPHHKSHMLKYFCRTCNFPICKECTLLEHPKEIHDYDFLTNIGTNQVERISNMVDDGKTKTSDLYNALKSVEHFTSHLQVEYQKAQNEMNETFQFYCSMLDERKLETLKELDSIYNSKMMSFTLLTEKMKNSIDKINQMCEFVDRIIKFSSNTEILMFKQLLDTKFQSVLSFNPDVNLHNFDLEFVSNYQAIQIGVRNTFGYIRHNSEVVPGSKSSQRQLQPIDQPSEDLITVTSTSPVPEISSNFESGQPFKSNILSQRFSAINNMGPFTTSVSNVNTYEKWSNGNSEPFQNIQDSIFLSTDLLVDFSNKFVTTSIYPLKSQIKRQKMIYHCKFGEFGVLEGQFTEPSGVVVNAQNDIIVADTNNHRIQVFDREGRFKFHFGECGKRDGQLLYPNRVSVVRSSGDIVVTERSPTHQIQVYNQYGQFVRKFGANILQHPRGVTVDNKGMVIVVECKVMRVIIFDRAGNVVQKFGCSKHLEFPNGVIVNDKQEIFISDNRAHCVKVFNYDGLFLRQIGGEGLTNYPIGVCINQNGEIIVADNHNNFNITIFTQDGQLVNAFESKVKHAQCFDVALMDDAVVLASKDYRLYIYRYVQIPGIGI